MRSENFAFIKENVILLYVYIFIQIIKIMIYTIDTRHGSNTMHQRSQTSLRQDFPAQLLKNPQPVANKCVKHYKKILKAVYINRSISYLIMYNLKLLFFLIVLKQ